MGGLNENAVLNIKNKSHSITAQVIVPEGKPCEGAILSQGGFAGGWIFYVKDAHLKYCYNFAGLEKYDSLGNTATPVRRTSSTNGVCIRRRRLRKGRNRHALY